MSDVEENGRVFREMKWAPGQKERANARAARIADKGSTREELIASGEIGAPVPWGELLDSMVAMRELRAAREQLGLSLGDVERRTGMARAQLSKLENGQTNPTMQTIVRYATGLGKRLRLVFEDLSPRDSEANGPPAPAQ